MVRAYVDTGQNHDDQFEKAPVISCPSKYSRLVGAKKEVMISLVVWFVFLYSSQSHSAAARRTKDGATMAVEQSHSATVPRTTEHTSMLVVKESHSAAAPPTKDDATMLADESQYPTAPRTNGTSIMAVGSKETTTQPFLSTQ